MRPGRILKSFSLGLAGVFAALFVMILPASAGFLAGLGGTTMTPSVYRITVTQIELFNGAWQTLFSGTCEIDIASASIGGSAGFCGGGETLGPGTYTQMRFTLSRTFVLQGSVADAGPGVQPCRTGTGGGTGDVTDPNPPNVMYSNVGVGSSDGGAATEQTLILPSASDGSIAASIDGVAGMTLTSDSISLLLDVAPFTVPEGEAEAPSGISLDFQVENKLDLLTTGAGACSVANNGPIISVTTSGGTTSFEPP